MSSHSKRSPSSAKANSACAGRLALIDALPDYQRGGSGDAARLGTCAHWLIELCLAQDVEPDTFEGRVIAILNEGEDEEQVKMLAKSAKTPSNTPWFEVDSDMLDGVNMMVHYVRDTVLAYALDGMECRIELESRTNPLPERDDTSGTADVTLILPKVKLEVVDYKNGYNVVEHIDNDQLLAYLLGKAIDYKWAFKEFQITVVQPNAEHEEGKIRPFNATKADLLKFQERYRAAIKRMEVAEGARGAPVDVKQQSDVDKAWSAAYLKAGEHCMFCDAKAVCPAYINRAFEQANLDFADDEPDDLPRPESADDVAKILRWKPYFDALFKAAFMYGQRTLEAGHAVEGFKLSKTKPHRRFIDKPAAELARMILKRFPALTREQLFHDELRTGPQIEKLLPKEERPKFSATFLYNPEGTLTIVPAEDSREEIVKHAGDDFVDDADELDFG